ncbi:hypothetical protein AS149_29855 [Burkholderia cenocepacia]|nr:hypothetical protein AS149_29855 [Burkholderia cenocepacia]
MDMQNRLPTSTMTDPDPEELREWCDALDGVLHAWGGDQGNARARHLLDSLLAHAHTRRVAWRPPLVTPYVNTVAPDEQPAYPGDLHLERRIAALIRWNALAMVVRANRALGELGGHIASYASAADLFAIGLLASPLRGAAVTFLCLPKKSNQKKGASLGGRQRRSCSGSWFPCCPSSWDSDWA